MAAMTVNSLYKQGVEYLEEADNENAGFDARCLMEYMLGIDTTKFIMIKDKKVDAKNVVDYLALIRRRALGEPLQYIIGIWEFMGNSFYVGKGVLIPRPETELLVEYADKFLSLNPNGILFDLCSGSGCIAISIAKKYPNAVIYAVEKSDEAFEYLERNITLNKVGNVRSVKGDICNADLLKNIEADIIVSNPPYIKTEDISCLQKEVRYEPAMALDGGSDGYDFYRILSSVWLPRLRKGCTMAVECAENQADEIAQMFYLSRSSVEIMNDLSGFPRVVTAKK